MRTQQIHSDGGQRTFAVIMDKGDEAMEQLKSFAENEAIDAAQITGIGAFENVTLRYFDWQAKQYHDNPVSEQVEVAALIGDISEKEDGKPEVHIHLVIGKSDGSALAGHLKSGRVRPTLELIVTESPAHLRRRKDPESGLALIRLKQPAEA